MADHLHAIEQRQKLQDLHKTTAQTAHEHLSERVEVVQQSSKSLTRRVNVLETPKWDKEIKDIQEQLLELKQGLANAKDENQQELKYIKTQHKQQLAHMTALVSSLIGPLPTKLDDIDTPKPVQILGKREQRVISRAEPELHRIIPLLHKMDFLDSKHLKALKAVEDFEFNLGLFSSTEKHENEAIAYSVRGRGPFSDYLVPGGKSDPNKISEYWKLPKWSDFPTILELNKHRKETIVTPMFPKYVWELGEI